MSSSSIKVAIRCRPLLGQERPTGGLDIQNRRILLDSKTYDPDYTFPPAATQDDVFLACRPILQCVKEGMNGTIMVYGQTGTGKTYTMLGNEAQEHGLVHKVVGEMLEYVQQKTLTGGQCALTLSMIEIYNERLTDMLSPNGEEEVTLISGFPRFTNKVPLCRVKDAIDTIQRGLAWRHTAATLMNERSSRSHVVFIFDLEEYNAFTDQVDVAHLFMIDLAGSESLKKSQASGVAAGEAGKINKSLLALKSVFLALSNTNEATRPSHVPYRDSKLTELLQDSIGGTARTLMIACISSVGRDIEETKSTLLYAVKARSIRNAANTEKEKLLVRLRSMEVENQKLRNRLQERVSERGGYYVTKEEHEQTQEMEESYKKLKESVEQLMQDRQSSDARLHIWESQVKLLQELLKDKDVELEKFQASYSEALQRFEHQGASLQRLVRGGVGEAKDAVQLSFADTYARLHTWRTELLNALEEPIPTGMPVEKNAVTEDDEEHNTHQQHSATQDEANAVSEHVVDRCSALTPPPAPAAAAASPSALPRGTSSLTPPGSPMRSEASTTATANNNNSNSNSGSANPLNHSRVGLGGARSARVSTTTSAMQRTSAASNSSNNNFSAINAPVSCGSGCASPSVSPHRRGARAPRLAVSAASSASTSRRATQTSPSLAACHHPNLSLPPLPTATTLQKDVSAEEDACEGHDGRTTETASRSTAAAGAATATSSRAGAVVVEASGALHVCGGGSTGGPSTPSASSWSAVLAQYDAQCVRAVQRLNDAVAAVLEACLRCFDDYKAQAESAEDRRRRGLEDVCHRLRRELDAHLTQLQRVDAAGEREVQDARQACRDQLQLQTRLRPMADAVPFQHAVRQACGDVVRHAAHAFPHPSTPAAAEAAMDVIVQRVRCCSANFSVQALDPLASSAVMLRPSAAATALPSPASPSTSALAARVAASGVSSATVGVPSGGASSPVYMDVAPMPRLSPPTTAEGAASVMSVLRDSGRPTARASLAPVLTQEDEERGSREDALGQDGASHGEGSSSISSSTGGSLLRDARLSPPPTRVPSVSPSNSVSQTRLGSPRASSLRSSAALSTMSVNRVTGRRGGQGNAGNGGGGGGSKRTRSNASSQRGEAPTRRTTNMHRALR